MAGVDLGGRRFREIALRLLSPSLELSVFFLSFSLSLFGRAREGFFYSERWLRPIASTVNQRVD